MPNTSESFPSAAESNGFRQLDAEAKLAELDAYEWYAELCDKHAGLTPNDALTRQMLDDYRQHLGVPHHQRQELRQRLRAVLETGHESVSDAVRAIERATAQP